jgi:hypothetical protein
MQALTLQSVTKGLPTPGCLFNWMGEERSGETRALDAVSRSDFHTLSRARRPQLTPTNHADAEE